MKWFKFYGQDYLSDPKMLALSASERSCWITLLSYSSINDNGMITFLSEQQLMLQAGLDFTSNEWDKTVGILEKLKKLDMINVDNGVITVKNWKKRQETSLTSYERVKRFREKKRNDNTKITLEENRIDKNRIDNTNTSDGTSQEIVSVIDSFKEVNSAYSKWYKNTTQRDAIKRLIKSHSLEKVLKVITLLPKTNGMSYMPTITTPLQLEDKWSQLEVSFLRKKNEIELKKSNVI